MSEATPDLGARLPADKQYFSVRYLARMWEVSERSIMRLIREGSLKAAPDLAPACSKHAMLRVERSDLTAFLNARADSVRMGLLRDANRRKRK